MDPISASGGSLTSSTEILEWVEEPPRQLRFSNSSGGHLKCRVKGAPPPHRVSWTQRDGRIFKEVMTNNISQSRIDYKQLKNNFILFVHISIFLFFSNFTVFNHSCLT